MRRKTGIFLLSMITAVCMLAGCETSEKKENNNSEQDSSSLLKEVETINESDDVTEKYEYPAEDNTSAVWDSEYGYSMTYDPSLFTADDAAEADTFTYNTAEKLDAPVYLSVQTYVDMDVQTLADGLVLQSGIDGVEAKDASFGADNLETKYVYVEQDVNGVKQIQSFYVIPMGEGSLLVEMGSYVGVPENVAAKMEEMIGTFKLK